MEEGNQEIQTRHVKTEFLCGTHCETGSRNKNLRDVEPQFEMEDSLRNVKTESIIPIYNLYQIKKEVVDTDPSDPCPSSVMLTSLVESETNLSQLDIPYFDHSSIIQQNLKTEPKEDEENCEDPLDVAHSVPMPETPHTSLHISVLPTEETQTTEQSQWVRSHTGEKMKPFKCVTCGKDFIRKGNLIVHLKKTHTGDTTFTCGACGKSFAVRRTLTLHMRSHTGKKPFQCETCGMGFKGRGSLREHVRTHTGEKPFNCGICGKSFARKGTLVKHVRTHTGEKPYTCATCGRSFSQKTTLTCHSRIFSH